MGQRRAISIGNENVPCVEYSITRLQIPAVIAECSGKRLHARFVGERLHLPLFYRMLEGIRVAKVVP